MQIIAHTGADGKPRLRLPDGALTIAVVLLASGASFGLGILVGEERAGENQPLKIEGASDNAALSASVGAAAFAAKATAPAGKITAPVEPAAPPAATSGTYVASKNGTKYYLPSCGSAKRIKEENKVWFQSKEEAQAAGFGPAANCPGL